MPIRSKFGHWAYTVEAKTAAYTVTAQDFGKIFTNRGAVGAVTFTLPPPATEFAGAWVLFYVEAGQNVTITTVAVDQQVAFNNATANSVAYSTVAELIGGGYLAVCNDNGTKWLMIALLGSETQTPTIAA